MANKPLKSIKFPELPDTYTIPQVDTIPTQGSTNAVSSGGVYEALHNTDTTLSQSGQAADAKAVGDALACKVDVRGVGQITPQNIQGVVVTGGNILDDAERIYCTQLNTQTTDGYVLVSGDGTAIIQTTSDYCSFLIPVKQNTHYTSNKSIRFAVLLQNLSTSGTTPVKYSTVVGSALANITSFDTGNADYIIVSWNYNTYPIDSFIISEGNTPTTERAITLPDWLKGEDYSAEIESIETRIEKLYDIKPLMDAEPTTGSTNAVQSGGVKSALDTLQAQIPQIDSTLSQSGQAADAKVVGDAIDGLEADLNEKIDIDGEHQVKPQNIEGVSVSDGNVLEDAERLYCTQASASTTDGYVSISNGTAIIQTTSDYCSFLISVKPNTHYTASNPIRFAVLLKDLNTSGTSLVRYSTVVGSALANISSFDTGEADHIIVSWNYTSFPIDDFIISEGNTPTTERAITLPDWLKGEDYSAEIESIETRIEKLYDLKPKYISSTGDLSDGTFIALMGYKQNLRKGERYVFSGNIGTISCLHFGFTYANVFSASTKISNEFTIDATNITYKSESTDENYKYQYAHGLTLANNLQFVFEYLPEGNAKITLISNGVLFTQTLPFTKWVISQVVVLSTGSTLTDCKLTWAPTDIEKNIWMFGDSYFAYSTARWTYYLQQYGYAKNTLIDGWPGEGSVNARNSLMTLIQFGTPKYIVWCMGMNDGSDTDASTPSSDWTVRRDEMLTICNENGITPIFATIPNVPSILHTGKNAWIKASGYRYIDFAAAVGAESADSTWFTGMLSTDNVHPTEQGARALFARVLLDFPEIMLDDWG